MSNLNQQENKPAQKKIKVLKFGGTSVKNPQRIAHVAQIVASVCSDYKTIVVVSAMGDTTDSLVRLAARCSDKPNPRELDVLLASGEQQSIALLSIVLSDLDIKAKSFTGTQLGIITESNYGNAEILSIDSGKIDQAFECNDVIVVAGFQGVTASGDITTLGRGGSDTSAVAIAAAVGAELCEIYTDVDGIFTADPNIIEAAIKHDRISYDDCLEMAAKGAQVIHPRAVECARENSVVLRVRSVFNPDNCGTVIDCAPASVSAGEQRLVGITAVDGFSVLKIEFDAAKIHSQLIHDTVQSEAGHVNLLETSVSRASSGAAFSLATYVVSGLNKVSGQQLVEELVGIPGVANVTVKFDVTRICLVGPGAAGAANSLAETVVDCLIEGAPLTSSSLFLALYVAQEHAKPAWAVLHNALFEQVQSEHVQAVQVESRQVQLTV